MAADQQTNPLDDLYREFLEADDDGASSNDIAQMLDDFLTKRGYPTVLYRAGRR
ncbi:hypothetical protein BDK92_7164 [Micromonospora pisi]|uniref:Uncharacterized protein n=1 Tax=Micromonospora pisi TaxID=589240 RepID=A0A495JUK0_9ACTN|nr:hypothetical protein [Micromonospora pisi]RKR92686.1 hypothetical protein BDK92_7164 [Micromonospora pisi]